MSATTHFYIERLPGRFEDLVHLMPPQAIQDDAHYESTVEILDQLMAAGKLTKGQALYLETLVQLVQAYEAAHHAIDTSDISGIDSLKHLLEENGMNASDLARLLDMHPSMGSKILRGEAFLRSAWRGRDWQPILCCSCGRGFAGSSAIPSADGCLANPDRRRVPYSRGFGKWRNPPARLPLRSWQRRPI